MCPLRFILVFFSAVLAGYFAWRTVRSSPEVEEIIADGSNEERTAVKDNQELSFKRVCFVSEKSRCFSRILWIGFLD